MATRASGSKARTEILDMLKQDHRKVKKAFSDFDKLGDDAQDRCEAIVEQTCADLELHAALEEELFYPALRRATDEPALLDEAEVEHKTLKMLIQELDRLQPDDDKFAATFKVLGEYTKHHVKEEESEMFERAMHAKVDWDGLLQEMQQRRDELMEELGLQQAPAAAAGANNHEPSRKETEVPE